MTHAVATAEQIERTGRLWESATERKRVALVVLGLGYLPAFALADLPWSEIGVGTQRDMARGLAELIWQATRPRPQGKDDAADPQAARAGG